MNRGHLPAAAQEIAALLQEHGFSRIDTNAIQRLVQRHKQDFIDEHIVSAERLRTEALAIDDLPVIAALLCSYVPQRLRPLPGSIADAPWVSYGDKGV